MEDVSYKILSGIYKIAGLVLPPVIALAFVCHPRGRRHLSERFGLWRLKTEDDLLWFHGASVGEVQGLLPIIEAAKKEFPNYKILLTATSPTGIDVGKNKVDYRFLLPFDNFFWLGVALKNLRVKAFLFGETEIWPSLYQYLNKRNVPMLLVNGRFSLSAERLWSRPVLKNVIRKCLSQVSYIFASNEIYRERFVTFGAKAETTSVNGNSKYDSLPSVLTKDAAQQLKKKFFKQDKPIVVVGSLRTNEEELLFPVFKKFVANGKLLFLIAPRHQERMNYFAEKLNEYGLQFERWSELKERGVACQSDVLLLDTLGELEKTYSFADLAIIGGTMADGMRGHNPLEAAAYGVPIALGEHHENIEKIVQELLKVGGLFPLVKAEDVSALLQKVETEDEILRKAGTAAQSIWKENQGACARIIDVLHKVIK